MRRIYTFWIRVILVAAFSMAISSCGGDDNGTAPAGDGQAPTTPTLTATAVSFSQIYLMWTPSSDNVGVVAYDVWRGHEKIATVDNNSYSDTGLVSFTTYTYTVAAYDSSGNISGRSAPASATTIIIATDYVAYYPLDGNALDASGNGNDGVVTGATVTANRFGIADSAYYFNGTTDQIRINNASSLIFGTGDFTISAWINGNSWDTVSPTNLMNIISKHNEDKGSWLFKVDKQLSGLGKFCFDFADNITVYNNAYCSNTQLTLGNWYHGVVTRAGDVLTIYVNGNADAAYSNNVDFLSTADVYIASQGNVTDEKFNGTIDDIRIYNRALSALEVQALYTLK